MKKERDTMVLGTIVLIPLPKHENDIMFDLSYNYGLVKSVKEWIYKRLNEVLPNLRSIVFCNIPILEFWRKLQIGQNSNLTSHDSKGFQLSPNVPEFERKWYGET